MAQTGFPLGTLKSLIPGVPKYLAFGLIAVFALMGFLIYDQNHWWRIKEDYSFGFIVPMFVAYIIYDRWPKFLKAVAAPMPGPASSGMRSLLNFAAWAGLFGGGLLFAFGALLRSSLPQPPASLALSLGCAVLTLSLLYLLMPDAEDHPGTEAVAPAGGLFSNTRVQATTIFLFPAMIWLLSAPMLGVIESELNIMLMNKVTFAVYNLFNFIGIPIIQEGNVLRLGDDNVVGVAEACSGIRSLTGCLFAGSFLAAVFLDTFWKKVSLVTTAALLAVFTNMLRSIFLTGWAYANGSKSIEGKVHDVTGFAVLGVTCVLLLCLLPLFNLKLQIVVPAPAGSTTEPKSETPAPEGR